MDIIQMTQYCDLALTWIGFGTVVGLFAKAVMPGRDPGGAIATVLMGIVGTLIGCAVLQFLADNEPVKPVSLEGFSVGVVGALILLTFYKLLGGHYFVEGETTSYNRRRRRRRRYDTVYDE